MAGAIITQSGIYQIRNIANGKRYIGSAVNLKARAAKHVSLLRGGYHHSAKMQAAWNKYGEAQFKFEVLLVCSRENLLMYEQRALSTFQSFTARGYNILPVAGSRLGVPATAASKQRASVSMKRHFKINPVTEEQAAKRRGVKRSAETRAKISRAKIGNKSRTGMKHTAEARAKIGASNSGKVRAPVSDATRLKLSKASLGRKHSPETIAKMRVIAANRPKKPRVVVLPKVRKHSLETRAKISAAHKKLMRTPEQVARFAQINVGRKQSPERIEQSVSQIRGVKMSADVGKKRWEMRRAKYGAKGHSGKFPPIFRRYSADSAERSSDSTGQPNSFKVKMTADNRQLPVICSNSGCVKLCVFNIMARQRAGRVFGLG